MAYFRIKGRLYDIDRQNIEQVMAGLEPVVDGYKPYNSVEVNGKNYPVKQVVREVTGLESKELITFEACRILDMLGYVVKYQR